MAVVKLLQKALLAAVLLSGLGLVAIALLWHVNARGSVGHSSSAAQVTNYMRSIVYTARKQFAQGTRLFNLSFPGFTTVCNDTLPPSYDGYEKLVIVTHKVCCDGPGSNESDGQRRVCRTARNELQIPAENERSIRATGERTINLDSIDFVRSFVFVTGTSPNHFRESLVQLNSIQEFFPCTRVLYWDLGLEPDQVKQLQTFCGVEYRRFNFSKYPPHVATLKTYAFKPLVLMESFLEHPVLWWVDSSIRFTSDAWRNVVPLVKQRHGMIFFRDIEHFVWSATYPQTFKYMATDEEQLKRLITVTGASFILANTPDVFSNVLYWFYACALDVRCIAPVMFPERCSFRGPGVFANCHRFDQSVLSIIVANVWGFNSHGYRYREDFFRIMRTKGGNSSVKQCSLVGFQSSLDTDVCRGF